MFLFIRECLVHMLDAMENTAFMYRIFYPSAKRREPCNKNAIKWRHGYRNYGSDMSGQAIHEIEAFQGL